MHRLALMMACIVALGGGCGAPLGHGRAPRPGAGEPPPMGFSVEGRAIRCWAYGHGPSVVVVLGGIHGNEPAGAALSRELCDYLESHPALCRRRQVVVTPAVNPDGLRRGQRANANGVDLNRNFATRNWRRSRGSGSEPLSEPEARFVAGLIRRYEPAVVVQIHQPLTCVDYDGPASALAAAMASACELPVKKLGARPGSLGSYAGVDRQIPTVTLELPKSASGLAPSALWGRYGEALLAAVRAAPERADGDPRVKVGGEVRLRWERYSR